MGYQAISTNQITGIGIGSIVVLVVVGLIVALVVSRLIVRVVVAVVVVALAVVIWTQRTAVLDAAQDAAARCDVTFFGIHIQSDNPQIRKACAQVRRH